MEITRGSGKRRIIGVVTAAAVCIMALAGPAIAAPPDSGAGGTRTNVVPATGSDGIFSLPANLYLAAVVLVGTILALAVYRRSRRGAVAPS